MKFEIEIPELFRNQSGIYKITNSVDSKVYIGRSRNLMKRALQHKRRFENGEGNAKIKRFLRENPTAVFRFSVEIFTQDIEDEEERLIAEYSAVEKGFNMVHNDDEFVMYKWDKPERKKRVAKKEPVKPSETIKLRKIPEKAKKHRRAFTKFGYSDTMKFCSELGKIRELRGEKDNFFYEHPSAPVYTKTKPLVSSLSIKKGIRESRKRRENRGEKILDMSFLCRK